MQLNRVCAVRMRTGIDVSAAVAEVLNNLDAFSNKHSAQRKLDNPELYETDVVPLRSGAVDPGQKAVYGIVRCEDYLRNTSRFPECTKLAKSMYDTTQYEIGRIVVSKMDGPSEVYEHYDRGSSSDLYRRTHLCLTVEDATFSLGSAVVRMKPGELWEINNKIPHSVKNYSGLRVHIIIDVREPAGRWLKHYGTLNRVELEGVTSELRFLDPAPQTFDDQIFDGELPGPVTYLCRAGGNPVKVTPVQLDAAVWLKQRVMNTQYGPGRVFHHQLPPGKSVERRVCTGEYFEKVHRYVLFLSVQGEARATFGDSTFDWEPGTLVRIPHQLPCEFHNGNDYPLSYVVFDTLLL